MGGIDGSGNTRAASLYGNAYLYTGRRYDTETALYYFRGRMYDAEVGRFPNRDPVEYPDGYNLYAGYFGMWEEVDPIGQALILDTGGSEQGNPEKDARWEPGNPGPGALGRTLITGIRKDCRCEQDSCDRSCKKPICDIIVSVKIIIKQGRGKLYGPQLQEDTDTKKPKKVLVLLDTKVGTARDGTDITGRRVYGHEQQHIIDLQKQLKEILGNIPMEGECTKQCSNELNKIENANEPSVSKKFQDIMQAHGVFDAPQRTNDGIVKRQQQRDEQIIEMQFAVGMIVSRPQMPQQSFDEPQLRQTQHMPLVQPLSAATAWSSR